MSDSRSALTAEARERRLLERLGDKFTLDPDGCWTWMGARSAQGYGYFGTTREGLRTRLAHRIVYELLVGLIPDGLTLHHVCKNRACVNPSHLRPVTRAEHNVLDDVLTARYARATHCVNGHEFTEANTHHFLRNGKGRRRCRACSRASWRRRVAA